MFKQIFCTFVIYINHPKCIYSDIVFIMHVHLKELQL